MKLLKKIIRRFLEEWGYNVTKVGDEVPQAEVPPAELEAVIPEPVYTPIEVFPLAVADLMQRKQDIFFIQIGAHDGLTYDPLRLFVDEYNWRGILLEPQPKIFAQLVENYNGAENLVFENAALSHTDGETSLYTFAEGSNLPSHATMLASFRRDALENNGHGYKGEIVETRVPTISMSTLLKKHNVAEVDILQIDTEGFDFEVIKMIDFSKIKPYIISYESILLSPADRNACINLLSSHGYRLAPGHLDTIAVLQRDYRESLLPLLDKAMAVPA